MHICVHCHIDDPFEIIMVSIYPFQLKCTCKQTDGLSCIFSISRKNLKHTVGDFPHRCVAQVINLTGQHGSLALQRINDHHVRPEVRVRRIIIAETYSQDLHF